MTTQRRLAPDDRRQLILEAAINLATADGYISLTRGAVASHAGISPALVTFYYLSTRLLLQAVMEEAVRREILPVIAEGLATRCPIALAAPPAVRQAAIAGLVV